MWPAIIAAVGLALGAGGTALSASAADRRRKGLFKIANEPGLDTKEITLQSLQDMIETAPTSFKVADLINQYYRTQLEREGLADLKRAIIQQTAADLAGEIPEDVTQQVFRSAAGRALTGGYAGSALHRGLVLRDLGLTSDALRQRGFEKTQALLAGMRVPGSFDPYAAGLLGLTPAQMVNLRSAERTQRLQMLAQAELLPRGDENWAKYMSSTGGMLTSLGTMGMMGAASSIYPGLAGGDRAGLLGGVGVGNPYGDIWRSYYGG